MYETSIFPKSISSKTPVQDKNDFYKIQAEQTYIIYLFSNTSSLWLSNSTATLKNAAIRIGIRFFPGGWKRTTSKSVTTRWSRQGAALRASS